MFICEEMKDLRSGIFYKLYFQPKLQESGMDPWQFASTLLINPEPELCTY